MCVFVCVTEKYPLLYRSPFENWILYATYTTTRTTKIQPNQLLQTAGVLSGGQYIVLARSVTANNNVEIYTHTCAYVVGI